MKWVALIYAAEWISVGLAVSTAIHVTGVFDSGIVRR